MTISKLWAPVAAAFALVCAFGAPPALADADDRSAAIAACRTAIATQLGVSEDAVDFDQSSTRGGRIDVRLHVRGTGADGRYACRYSRSTDSVVGVAAGTQASVGDVIQTATAAGAASN
jgi:hypothetical protein